MDKTETTTTTTPETNTTDQTQETRKINLREILERSEVIKKRGVEDSEQSGQPKQRQTLAEVVNQDMKNNKEPLLSQPVDESQVEPAGQSREEPAGQSGEGVQPKNEEPKTLLSRLLGLFSCCQVAQNNKEKESEINIAR